LKTHQEDEIMALSMTEYHGALQAI